MYPFVINLERRKDRKDRFRENHGCNFEFIKAIENKLDPIMGCTLSHLLCISKAKEESRPYAIIFEDDAKLRIDMEDVVKHIGLLDNKVPSWEILLLSISYGAHLMFTNIDKINDKTLLLVNHIFNGTYAMVVSNKAYDKIINQINKVIQEEKYEVDVDVYMPACEGNIYIFVPFLAEVITNDQSNIRTYNTDDDIQKVLWCEQVLLINNT